MHKWTGRVRLAGGLTEVTARMVAKDDAVSVEISRGKNAVDEPAWEPWSPYQLDPESLCLALAKGLHGESETVEVRTIRNRGGSLDGPLQMVTLEDLERQVNGPTGPTRAGVDAILPLDVLRREDGTRDYEAELDRTLAVIAPKKPADGRGPEGT